MDFKSVTLAANASLSDWTILMIGHELQNDVSFSATHRNIGNMDMF
jgi:hypothetical protein